MKTALEATVEDIHVTGEATPNSSGAFEVMNAKTKRVYHSKLGGDGYLDEDQHRLMAVCDAISDDA